MKRCPPSVYQLNKLNGSNDAVLLTFSSGYMPDYLIDGHVRIRSRNLDQTPFNALNCLEFGHLQKYCLNEKYVTCSVEHEVFDVCSLPKYCFHCRSNHLTFPNAMECCYKLEREIVKVAFNEHNSIDSSKHKVLGAKKDHNLIYKPVIKLVILVNNKKAKASENGVG